MKATIHAEVLEEEGEALASGSCLVLRKVCILIVVSRLAREWETSNNAHV